jgi:poly(3-hydroxybutyrate) depolymerase
LQEGDNANFASGGEQRHFIMRLPSNTKGAGLLFTWHWLNGSAQQILQQGFNNLPNTEDVIVVSPSSCCGQYEWQTGIAPAQNVDLQFFDDILACVHEQYDIDLDRVWSTGHSAGGLWTSYLAMHRAEHLAAMAALSGGIYGASSYTKPAAPIPVMLVWGGESDTYGSFSFDQANKVYSQQLKQDGHFVVECSGNFGHSMPPEPLMVWPFFRDHPRGITPEPWAGGLPSELPGWCTL